MRPLLIIHSHDRGEIVFLPRDLLGRPTTAEFLHALRVNRRFELLHLDGSVPLFLEDS